MTTASTVRVELGLLAARLNLTTSDVERLLAGVTGVHLDGDHVNVERELLAAVAVAFEHGVLAPAELLRGVRATAWTYDRRSRAATARR